MAKVLTVTPTEGESPEDFAKRVSEQIDSFFGGEDAPTDEAGGPTDVSAEPVVEEQPEG